MNGNISRTAFPGGSKERVNRAGRAVRSGTADLQDYLVIEQWRAAHRHVLNTFQAILRNRTQGSGVIVAQRHKRRSTIFDKLQRFRGMELARMDDVAGCRLIFENIEELREFRNHMHRARFRHTLKNESDKYDYISRPKSTGYRGIHDVYSYDVSSHHGEGYKGLLIEIQYRTLYQHAWATAVEVIGFITESQPKFQQGDKRYQYALSLASEIISRNFENEFSCHANLTDSDLVRRFLNLDRDLGLMRTLRALNASRQDISEKNNIILIFREKVSEKDHSPLLEARAFRDATDALQALFKLEKDEPSADVVLVRASSSDAVRTAFRNYFSDAREFIRLIDQGCARLAGGSVIEDDAVITAMQTVTD